MKFIPATKISAALATPVSRRAQIASRVTVGSLAAAGAVAFLSSGAAAEAKTATTGKTTIKKATAVKPQPVNKYSVVKGDTLSHIASRSGVSIDALVRANGISTTKLIKPGQKLVIPTAKSTSLKGSKVSKTGVMPTDLPSSSTRLALHREFSAAATKYGVPVSFLEAMAWNESGWQNSVVSSKGALGIGQVMPSTVDYVNTYLVKQPLNPKTTQGNISIAASYLHHLIQQNHGDYKAALAAYYQGDASVKARGNYDDTNEYVANVLALQNRYFR